MLWGGHSGGLEVRTVNGETRLRGKFPYNSRTELRSGRFEMFESRAFGARVQAGEDIHLLSGHDYAKPLASRSAGNLTIEDDDDGLTIEAVINEALRKVTFVSDAMSAVEAGLVRGLSPGFRVAKRPNSETVERTGGGLLRRVKAADLMEISVVTRPAYPQAQVEARSWGSDLPALPKSRPPQYRWRA